MELVKHIKEYHANQFDSHGCPYWLHPYRVSITAVKLIAKYGLEVNEEVVRQTALLHDVFEDTNKTPEEVLADGFLQEAIDNAMLLSIKTKVYAGMSYDEKVQYLINTGTLETLVVKLADNKDNSLIWRDKEIGVRNTKYNKSKEMLKQVIQSAGNIST